MRGKLDAVLNNITMYRLLAYGLGLLAFLSILLGFMGTLTVSPLGLCLSLLLLLASSYAINALFARVWEVPANSESWLITALILFFILPPTTTVPGGIMVFLAGVIAMASKFLLAYRGKHLFNPAAFAASVLVLPGLLHVTWWVGSSVLWPFTLLFGLIVVRKIRRGYLVIAFALCSLATILLTSTLQQQAPMEVLKLTLTSSPFIFLGTIMLTEPATMPARKNQQLLFAAIVALLYASQQTIFGVYIYPEVALLIGNAYAFTVSEKQRLDLILKQITPISDQVADYIFTAPRRLGFLPGQYLEWTLPGVESDERGNRRTFTIASSPTESDIHVGVKFYQPSSAFKQRLRALQPGDHVFAGQVGGNFTLPKHQQQKLVFIAGGIGITPFRSMLQYLLDNNQKRDITLLYFVSKLEEVAYKDVLTAASTQGVCRVYVYVGGSLTEELLHKVVPDPGDRQYLLSGPNVMVRTVKQTLRTMGIARKNIKTDYFAGY